MRSALATIIVLLPAGLSAQATIISAPEHNYFLRITHEWGQQSSLGELPSLNFAPEDREVRLWVGYGTTRTRGIILRRRGEVWSGASASVVRCMLIVPLAVADTMGPAAEARFHHEAKAHCGERSAPEGRLITADTLQLNPIELPSNPDSIWTVLLSEGLMTLPATIPRAWIMDDGTTFVLEVREGASYRASVIEKTTPPESPDDGRIQSIALTLGTLH